MISFQTLFYFLACNAVMLVIAMVMEALLGWPDWLYRKIGHPVSWIAKLITWCDTRLNRNSASSFRRKSAGIVTLLCCAGSAAVIAGGLAWLAGAAEARTGTRSGCPGRGDGGGGGGTGGEGTRCISTMASGTVGYWWGRASARGRGATAVVSDQEQTLLA